MTRFWSKVHKTDVGCWEWQAGRFHAGYGKFRFEGRNQAASRVAWRLVNGQIPPKHCVCHKCDNRGCVRPSHLFLGTYKDNTQDGMRKGRIVAQPKKLTHEKAAAIRAMRKKGRTITAIAKCFGVSPPLVSQICLGRVWK